VNTVLTEKQKETVLANLPLVEHIVNRISINLPANHSRDDLVQTATMGLISAAVRYDPANGTAFSTFAGRRIEGAIIDLLRQADWAPRSVRTLERRLTNLERGHRSPGANGSPGAARSAERIMSELGIDRQQLDRLHHDIDKARLDSLDRPVRTDGDGAPLPLSSTVFDQADTIEHRVEEQELLGYLRGGVALLPERHRTVVIGYFFEGRSMTELGSFLGVTQSRASQIKEEAVTMLRQGLAEVYRDGPSVPMSDRQRSFANTMAAARGWQDRIAAGKGLSISG
jgi:RNA polymerase sigma factor for flagellar operon FliA